MVVLLLGQRLARCRGTTHQHQRVESLHVALPVLIVAAREQRGVHARGRDHATRLHTVVIDVGDGRLIASQGDLFQSVGPVVIGQRVLHHVLLLVLNAEGIEGSSELVAHGAARTIFTHRLSHPDELQHSIFFYKIRIEVGLLHQPEYVGRPVVHDASHIAREFQHALVSVAHFGFAALDFIIFGHQLLVGHTVIAVLTVLVSIEYDVAQVVGALQFSRLIIFSTCSFSEIKTRLSIAFAVWSAVLLVV